jgi:hypothetical protein
MSVARDKDRVSAGKEVWTSGIDQDALLAPY